MSPSSELTLVTAAGRGCAARTAGGRVRARGVGVRGDDRDRRRTGSREREEHPRDPRPRRDGGTELAISASGDDAAEAVAELANLVASSPERRIASRTASRRDGATLSSSTPRPTKSGVSSGSPAASPQTSTEIPAACAASTVRRISSHDRRVAGTSGEAPWPSRSRPERVATRSFVPIEKKSASSASSAARAAAAGVSIIAPSIGSGRPAGPPRVAGGRGRRSSAWATRRAATCTRNRRPGARAQNRGQLSRERVLVLEHQRDAATADRPRGTAASCPPPKSSVRTVATRPASRREHAARARRRAPPRRASPRRRGTRAPSAADPTPSAPPSRAASTSAAVLALASRRIDRPERVTGAAAGRPPAAPAPQPPAAAERSATSSASGRRLQHTRRAVEPSSTTTSSPFAPRAPPRRARRPSGRRASAP